MKRIFANFPTLIPFLACGALLALASIYAETALGVAATLLLGFSLAIGVRLRPQRGLLWGCFWFGVSFSALAFYWLPKTISFFGGFPGWLSILLFALFCITGALQFVLCGWIYYRIAKTPLQKFFFALPLAWGTCELLIPRLFPWHLGHCVVGWTALASLADVGGVVPISMLIVWWGELTASVVFEYRNSGKIKYAPLLALLATLVLLPCIGWQRNKQVEAELSAAPEVKVALIQGNLAAQQKKDVHFFDVNMERYAQLTDAAVAAGAELVLWPESVVNRWMPESLASVKGTEFDPQPMLKVPLLYGGLSFRERPLEEIRRIIQSVPEMGSPRFREALQYLKYNSALLVQPGGDVLGRYHKRVLMPFGEYLPFAETFPKIKLLSPQTGDFAFGDLNQPLTAALPARDAAGAREVRIGALICYEDLVPELSREAALLAANVLVNITNDAWYGETAAPYQHHLLAQWRAIETRRYLLRVTNTGLTAIVDPFGRTIEQLPIFEEGVINENIRLLERQTLFARIGSAPLNTAAWILLAAAVMTAIFERVKVRKS